MAAQKETYVCIFKPLRSDTVSKEGRLSAHLETPNLNWPGRCCLRHVPFSCLTLTTWALLFKHYLATDFVSFASSGTACAARATAQDEDEPRNRAYERGVSEEVIHSLEIADHDTISDVVRRVQGSATQQRLDPALLPYINTMLMYRQRATHNATSCTEKAVVNGLPADERPNKDSASVVDRLASSPNMDIYLTMTNNRGSICLDLELSASKFSQPFAHRLLNTYRHILALISIRSPSHTVRSFSPLTIFDLSQICEWNARVPRPHDACLHAVIKEQARRRPQAPAVCSWDGDLTYAELDALFTKLAHQLSRLGVGPEVLVPYAF